MDSKGPLKQIGEIARLSGFSTHAIRYYEKEGLLGKPRRMENGYRVYPEATVGKLRFIKKAQGLGLRLSEIKRVMACSEEGLKPCCDLVRRLFEKKISEFDSKIKEMQRMKRELAQHLEEWVPPKDLKRASFSVCPQIETKKIRRLPASR